jgi:hypothetical protein
LTEAFQDVVQGAGYDVPTCGGGDGGEFGKGGGVRGDEAGGGGDAVHGGENPGENGLVTEGKKGFAGETG